MFKIVLCQPEIAPNTGNIIRLCANGGCQLHLIEPLGFSLGKKQLRRAGLDYHELVDLQTWPHWPAFQRRHGGRIISFSTRGEVRYDQFRYQPGDALLFGAESSGLPSAVRDAIHRRCRLRIPMRAPCRSLNLSNSVAVVMFEAWRQHGFSGDCVADSMKQAAP